MTFIEPMDRNKPNIIYLLLKVHIRGLSNRRSACTELAYGMNNALVMG